MFPNKINQISDPIHGSIQISELEKDMVSTQVFNRLHHILQNSTVYLTFPSNKTSRFAHSLGAMHLGGEMFRYSIANGGIGAPGQVTISSLLLHIDKHLENLLYTEQFKGDLKGIFDGIKDFSETYKIIKLSEGFDEPLYTVNTPFCIPRDSYYSYIVTFQSLRCAALLHDLGHPPFSHITEDALDNIFSYIQKKANESADLTERERNYIRIIDAINKRGKLHEVLSKDLSEHIFNVLIKDVDILDGNKTKLKKLFYAHVKHTTLAILNNKDEVFRSLHSILDGVIDCDRLDYVSRDTLASGFDDGTIEYDRLTKTMKLVIVKDQAGQTKFEFCPSGSALSTIEDFLKRRWKLYKNVINHHRVVKTDTLLRTIIEVLAVEYLSKVASDEALIDYKIPTDISGLWKTVDVQSNLTDGDYINHLTQWDDAWLIACLRSEYFERIKSEKDSILVVRLEELLSNRKKYTSLYKRLDGFQEIDLSILDNFNDSILDAFDEDPRIGHNVKMIKGYKKQYGTHQDSHPSVGLFANILDELFKNLGQQKTLDTILHTSIQTVVSQFNVDNYIITRNKLKTGIDGSAKIYYGDNIHSVESYSRIGIELTDNKSLVPPYYIYIYTKSAQISERDFRKELGKQISIQIERFFKENKKEDV